MKQKIGDIGEVPFTSTTAGDTGDSDVAAATALTGVVNENFVAIRDWIKWFLQNESEVHTHYWLAQGSTMRLPKGNN